MKNKIRIDHIALYTYDLEAVKAFFITYFNATSHSMYENPRTGLKSYFLTFSEGTQLELMWRPETKTVDKGLYTAGYTHLSFSVGGQAQVDALTERLKHAGFKVISGPRITGDGYYESCIEGPEHNLIEITE